MTLTPLPLETQAATGFTHKATLVAATDLTTTATTQTIQIWPQSGYAPAGTMVTRAGFNLTTAFDSTDTTATGCTIIVGDTDDDNRYIASQELCTDGTEITFWVSSAAATSTFPYAITASTAAVTATLVAAGGASPTAAEVDTGQVEIYLGIYDMNNLETA